jgi:hypothetical protein
MHPDDLKAIWICHECRRVFIFHSDVDDHEDLTGHKMVEKVMIFHQQRPWHNNNCQIVIIEAAAPAAIFMLQRLG